MRWEIIKKAWSLANKQYPKVKRLYVDMPERFTGSGDCLVIDLDKPDELLGKISYQARCDDGKPVLSMKLEEAEEKAALSKNASFSYSVASKIESFSSKNIILASDIMTKYQGDDLAEQVAYLIAGHEEGLRGQELDTWLIESWINDHGFPAEITAGVEESLSNLGIKVAKRGKRRLFQNYEKVRVVDPHIMEYNEGARIITHRRDKDSCDWYQIIVDGSDKPIWLNEKQLAKNTVGSVSEISSIDKGQK